MFIRYTAFKERSSHHQSKSMLYKMFRKSCCGGSVCQSSLVGYVCLSADIWAMVSNLNYSDSSDWARVAQSVLAALKHNNSWSQTNCACTLHILTFRRTWRFSFILNLISQGIRTFHKYKTVSVCTKIWSAKFSGFMHGWLTQDLPRNCVSFPRHIRDIAG